jgi:hypothetical protein
MNQNAIRVESDLLQGKGCTITLNEQSFEIGAKTPRQSRRLMAKMAEVAPMLAGMAGMDFKNVSPEKQSALLAAFEPMSVFISACADDDPDVVNALEYASEIEVSNAFAELAKMLSAPFVQRLKKLQNGKKPSSAIRHSGTSATPEPKIDLS